MLRWKVFAGRFNKLPKLKQRVWNVEYIHKICRYMWLKHVMHVVIFIQKPRNLFPRCLGISRLVQNLGTHLLSLLTYARRLFLPWATLGHTRLFICPVFPTKFSTNFSCLPSMSFSHTFHPLDVRILFIFVQKVRMALFLSFCNFLWHGWGYSSQCCVLKTSSICVHPSVWNY